MGRAWIEDQNPARGPENSGHYFGSESPVYYIMFYQNSNTDEKYRPITHKTEKGLAQVIRAGNSIRCKWVILLLIF